LTYSFGRNNSVFVVCGGVDTCFNLVRYISARIPISSFYRHSIEEIALVIAKGPSGALTGKRGSNRGHGMALGEGCFEKQGGK